ncbi:MAG: galactose-1-phosphate uridylyltransferase [Candidatus Tectomicrobia bacterium]|uniref:Galactose-1-phosphate uridylyltransferase n=1 Tax=Tectimicrobiota bacterium TaxID=2528274 RepID=A0A932GQQ5_UNCTE|nr:galactose-1-phosphate uridylyltransferase [Candidatus Tectomicrobia bacterium]
MPELRKDPILGRWVIISTERAARPKDFKIQAPAPQRGTCPFCPGNESMTPPEILAYRPPGSPPDTPGWTLRVIPNKFPALRIEGNLDRSGIGVYDRMNGVGAHEVIIETPRHDLNLSQASESTIRDVLWSYRERLVDLKKDPRLRYTLIFKNHGEAAGASLEHSHSQIIALPIIPQTVALELYGCKNFFDYHDRCIFCDILEQELEQESRIIENRPATAAFTPYASRFPFEVWIMPRKHLCGYEDATALDLEDLARTFSAVLRRLEKVLGSHPYNLIMHTAAFDDRYPQTCDYYHWHFEIMPTLTRVAGFEWGTGFFINPVLPEEAARYLREVSL